MGGRAQVPSCRKDPPICRCLSPRGSWVQSPRYCVSVECAFLEHLGQYGPQLRGARPRLSPHSLLYLSRSMSWRLGPRQESCAYSFSNISPALERCPRYTRTHRWGRAGPLLSPSLPHAVLLDQSCVPSRSVDHTREHPSTPLHCAHVPTAEPQGAPQKPQ